jgi:hypothetical protein
MQLSYQNKCRRIALQDVGDAIIDLIVNILHPNGHLLARLVELCATDRAVQRNSKSVDSEFLSSALENSTFFKISMIHTYSYAHWHPQ